MHGHIVYFFDCNTVCIAVLISMSQDSFLGRVLNDSSRRYVVMGNSKIINLH